MLQYRFDRRKRKLHTRRCIRVREHNSAIWMVLCKILLRHNAEIFIERDLLVRNTEFLRPDIVEGIRNVREKNRFVRVKIRHKRHRQNIIRTNADKNLLCAYVVDIRNRLHQFCRGRIRIETEGILFCYPSDRLCGFW